jgi:phosphatidylethanolamine/phosphatidyl-N-methylethanolamine N-methyltransferase
MPIPVVSCAEKKIRRQENLLFFRRWLKHPLQMGTLAPITPKLARLAASAVSNKAGLYVEIGAGTGRLSRALLQQGIKPENLALVELDPFFCGFLKQTLPSVLEPHQALPVVIEGDAAQLPTFLPDHFVGQVDVVFSVIPLMYLSPTVRQAIMEAAFRVLKPGGSIIHVTYSPRSPLDFMPNIHQHRQGKLWLNLPPGFVWHYQQMVPLS